MDLKITPTKSISKKLLSISAIITAVIISISLYFSFTANQQKIARVVEQFSLNEIVATGTIIPLHQHWLSAKSVGQVEQVFVNAGDNVNIGDPVAKLANPQLESERATLQIEANILAAEFLGKQLDLENSDLNMQQQLSDLKSELRLNTMKLEAETSLAHKGIISQYDLARVTEKQQQLQFKVENEAQRYHSFIRNKEAQMQAQNAKKEGVSSKLQAKTEQVNNLLITAKMSGVVQSIDLTLGQTIQLGDEIAVIAKMSPLHAKISVAQNIIAQVFPDMPVDIFIGEHIVKAKVDAISPSVKNGAVEVNVVLPKILPKETKTFATIKAVLYPTKKQQKLWLEQGDQFPEGELQVSVIDTTGKITDKTIKLGQFSHGKREVVSGLTLNDQILFKQKNNGI